MAYNTLSAAQGIVLNLPDAPLSPNARLTVWQTQNRPAPQNLARREHHCRSAFSHRRDLFLGETHTRLVVVRRSRRRRLHMVVPQADHVVEACHIRSPPITDKEIWQIGWPGSKSVDVGCHFEH